MELNKELTKDDIKGLETERVSVEPAQEDLTERPLPDGLRYFMFGLLVVGVVGVVAFGYVRQTSIKPPTILPTAGSCKDPVTENRLRETLKQSPNDYATLMDWGRYNLDCEKNYQVATAAFKQAVALSEQPNTAIKPMERNTARFQLGLAYLYNLSMADAQGQFEQIIKDDPTNASALLALGASYGKQDPQKAISYFKQVVGIDPNGDFGKQAQSLIDELSKATPTAKP